MSVLAGLSLLAPLTVVATVGGVGDRPVTRLWRRFGELTVAAAGAGFETTFGRSCDG